MTPDRCPDVRSRYVLPTITALLALVASANGAETFSDCPKDAKKGGETAATVVKVVDGDTLDFKRAPAGRRTYRLRLAEIDAPEEGQPYGKEATALLSALTLTKPVTIHYETCDQYGRYVGHIVIGKAIVNNVMIERGAAWFYSEYSNSAELFDLENKARDAKMGLWALPAAKRMEPWEWRKLPAPERKKIREQ